MISLRARAEELRRQARRDALLRPFRKVAQFLRRGRGSQGTAPAAVLPPRSHE